MEVEAVERGLAEVRQEMQKLREAITAAQLPSLLTMVRAAHELSVSLTTLKLLIRSSEVLTVRLGKRRMVPASEVRRVAALPNRELKKPSLRKSQLQDSSALRR